MRYDVLLFLLDGLNHIVSCDCMGQLQALCGAGGGSLGNHYGYGNRRYDDDDDYLDRCYFRRAGYRDGYYRHDNGHYYGQYK
ncbi:hypothetical protein ACV35P_33250, partial [Pseudomonas aeruginosa]